MVPVAESNDGPLARFRSGMTAPGQLPPREEGAIVGGWPEGPPEVSVCCAVYNHRDCIEAALGGFLAQETSFRFEIVVRDDASDDGTTEILRDYAARYPSIIRLSIEPHNTYRLGERPTFVMFGQAKGRYIALCEGDDYWFSRDKLQRQYDLMECNPASPMCVAWTVQCSARAGILTCDALLNRIRQRGPLLEWESVVQGYFHTSTFFLRREALEAALDVFSKPEVKPYFSDTPLQQLLAAQGALVLLPEVVSIYRQNGVGSWTSLDRQRRLEWDIGCHRWMLKQFGGRRKSYYGQALLDLHLLMWRQGRLTFSGRTAWQNLAEFLRLTPYLPALLRASVGRRIDRVRGLRDD